jgi:hypothetical protein
MTKGSTGRDSGERVYAGDADGPPRAAEGKGATGGTCGHRIKAERGGDPTDRLPGHPHPPDCLNGGMGFGPRGPRMPRGADGGGGRWAVGREREGGRGTLVFVRSIGPDAAARATVPEMVTQNDTMRGNVT